MKKNYTDTQLKILNEAIKEYTSSGDESLSMRHLATNVGIAPSVIYHHFASKEVLMREMFDHASHQLGRERAKLETDVTVGQMFRDRIRFQLDHSQMIMAVLKYYMEHPEQFKKQENGYLPPKSALHIEEVLQKGVDEDIYHVEDLEKDSKVIAHSINGFVTEYHGHQITKKERDVLVDQIATFFERVLVDN